MTPIVQKFFPDDPKRQWFQRMENLPNGVRYVGLGKGLAHIAHVFDTQGPFDGVLGFSQGAGMSLYVACEPIRTEPSERASECPSPPPDSPFLPLRNHEED